MLPYLAPSLEYNPAGPRLIAHVAFTATGGWFHRYTNGTVNWSNEKRSGTELMGAAFHAAVNQVRLENPERKEHCITFVTFGYANTVLMRFENGNCRLCWEGATTQWDGIHPPDHPYLDGEMAGEIARRTKDKWILGENTTLCQTDKTKYFLEWYRGSEAQYFYKLGDDQLHERIGGIIRGEGNNHRTVANAQNMQLVSNFSSANHAHQ